jgi:DNA-binding transcriptional LysR family regulator
MFETPLFDRSQRSARLTAKGEEMFLVAKRLLEQRDAAIEQFQRPEILVRRIRIGVTELTAMTWLPRLVSAIQSTYPRVVIEPDVDVSLALKDKLLTDDVDLMIVPQVFEDQRLVVKKVGVVENVWMCKPGLVTVGRRLRMQDLVQHRLLTQDNRSGTGQLYNTWLQSIGIQPENTILSNSLVTLIALTISGMGVSVLPKNCLQQMIHAGALQVLPVTPILPLASYAAVYRAERKSAFIEAVATLAQDHCDFGTIFQSA